MLLWHGSQRFDGRPEIRSSRKGRAEHGPGIYLTTNLETAWRYAKGGGRLFLFDLEDDIEFIQGSRVRVAAMLDFLRRLPRLPKRKQLYADVQRFSQRFDTDEIPASGLVNLMVNADALSGDNGPALARFLVDHGIDADCVKQGNEDWIVLFNPALVRSFEPRSRTEIPVSMYDLPRIC